MGTQAGIRLTVPEVLQAGHEDTAAALVVEYLARKAHGPAFTGGSFETVGSAWETPASVHAITPVDLIAVTMLSVNAPARASIDILDHNADKISRLLARIDPGQHLVDAADALLLGAGSPCAELWWLLRGRRGRPGLGPNATGKVLARKRPDLFPVHDVAVSDELAWKAVKGYWLALRAELQADDRALWRRLNRLKEVAAPDHPISPLRIFDIVTWMEDRRQPKDRSQDRVPAQRAVV